MDYNFKYTKTPKPPTHWAADCIKWRGRILDGPDAHWCCDWDDLPIDALTPEYDCCTCKKTLKGRIYNWLFMKWWNFQEWKAMRNR